MEYIHSHPNPQILITQLTSQMLQSHSLPHKLSLSSTILQLHQLLKSNPPPPFTPRKSAKLLRYGRIQTERRSDKENEEGETNFSEMLSN